MTDTASQGGQITRVALAIAAIALLYFGSALLGLPQRGTELIVRGGHDHQQHAAAGDQASAEMGHGGPEDHAAGDHGGAGHEPAEGAGGASAEAAPGEAAPAEAAPGVPPYWSVIPFVLLLGAIAVLPLLRVTEHWWESNLHRFYVAAGLGVVTLLYYGLYHGHPVTGHWPAHHVVYPTGSGPQLRFVWTVIANAILEEYIPFIVLLFSLYTISGGIRIEGDLEATPLTNAAFILAGGVLASFVGTTGAAMLLIRPLLETNRERKFVQHTVVFFIFVVCNCGGCLLPIGDPPLFLGYLRGVDFFWTLRLWPEWAATNGLLLLIYVLIDHFVYHPREAKVDLQRDVTYVRRLRFEGIGLNGVLLLGVVASVALLAPAKAVPGTTWHPWMYLREVVQIILVAISLWFGKADVRRQNAFNYHAIVEVAALFSGIFICMQPALDILRVAGPNLGIDTSTKFFWITGGLSSVLDNAPTYVVFFETARAVSEHGTTLIAGVSQEFLVPISLGAVFMGAMTYIGNGPNFMVKAIAEKSGVPMPSFFGYIFFYSVPILLPILIVVTLVFV